MGEGFLSIHSCHFIWKNITISFYQVFQYISNEYSRWLYTHGAKMTKSF